MSDGDLVWKYDVKIYAVSAFIARRDGSHKARIPVCE
jgi:hypothetical protein